MQMIPCIIAQSSFAAQIMYYAVDRPTLVQAYFAIQSIIFIYTFTKRSAVFV